MASSGATSFFNGEDVSTLTSFSPFDSKSSDGDRDNILSSLFYKMRTAVTMQQPSESTGAVHSFLPPYPITPSNNTDAILLSDGIGNGYSIISNTRFNQPKTLKEREASIVNAGLDISSVACKENSDTMDQDDTGIDVSENIEKKDGESHPVSMATVTDRSVVSIKGIESDGGLLTKVSSSDSDNHSVMTNFSVSNYNSLSRIIARFRGEQMNNEFWMPDAQCKECFDCNKPFKFYRRKHHCRNCGQIFCSNCTSHIIDGKLINQSGQSRVCNFCFSKIQTQQKKQLQDTALMAHRTVGSDAQSSIQDITQGASMVAETAKLPATPITSTPTPKRPGQYDRAIEGASTSSAVLGRHNTGYPSLPTSTPMHNGLIQQQYGSDTSFKKFFLSTIQPWTNGTTRQTCDKANTELENFAMSMELTNPFRQDPSYTRLLADNAGGTVLPPSEHEFSGSDIEEDEAGIRDRPTQNLLHFMGAGNLEDGSGIEASKYFTHGEHDGASDPTMALAKRTDNSQSKETSVVPHRRQSLSNRQVKRQRTQSLMRGPSLSRSISNNGDGNIKTCQRQSTPIENCVMSQGSESTTRLPPDKCVYLARHRRVSSVSGPVELNVSSVNHMRKLLRYLLNEKQNEIQQLPLWEDVMMKLLLKISSHVNPDIRGGDKINIRHYVKIKKIAGGQPKDSYYVKGAVCSKNVAHKRMVRTIRDPRILILLFPLEWSRYAAHGEHQVYSFDRVIAQEEVFIKKLINRIIALKPSVVLVSSNVSRLALDFLTEADIAVAYNIRRSTLEAVARCTGASIIPSFPELNTDDLTLGHCGMFEVKTIVHEWLPNRRKTFLLFHQCPPHLGATIVLRGAKPETLSVVKSIMYFMVFVVHNLRLESHLLYELSLACGTPVIDQEKDKDIKTPRKSAPQISASLCMSPLAENCKEDTGRQEALNKIVCLKPLRDITHNYMDATLSSSPMVVFPVPYLFDRLQKTQHEMMMQVKQTGQHSDEDIRLANMEQYFRSMDLVGNPKYEQLLEDHHNQWRAIETYIGDSTEALSPIYYQQLVVSYTTICVETGVPCQGPEMRMFDYYQHGADMTLGQYIEEIAADAHGYCTSVMCERTLMEHYRSYTHNTGRVNVHVKPIEYREQMSETHDILMWIACTQCPTEQHAVPMSDCSWKYSFGKFLELLFYHNKGESWPSVRCSNKSLCNQTYYFEYKGVVVSFYHETIEPFDIYVPPMHFYISIQQQIAAKEEALDFTRSKIAKFYDSIVERNKAFSVEYVHSNKVEACKQRLEEMSRSAITKKKQMLQYLQSVYATTEPTDALSVKAVRTQLQSDVLQWDAEYEDFVRQYVRPERELRRHLKKMFPFESSTNTISSLDVRTRRAIEAVDLPLLDIGLDGGCSDDTFNISADSYPDENHSPKEKPSLGESPLATEPWLEEEMRFKQIIDKMARNTGNEKAVGSTTSDHAHKNNNDTSDTLDPSVARRLSLELMKNTRKSSDMWQGKSDKAKRTGRTRTSQDGASFHKNSNKIPAAQESLHPDETPFSIPLTLGDASSALPILSSSTYRQLSDIILPFKMEMSKSKSSPPVRSRHIMSQLPETSVSSRNAEGKKTKSSRQNSIRFNEQDKENEKNLKTYKLALNGYHYGLKSTRSDVTSRPTQTSGSRRYSVANTNDMPHVQFTPTTTSQLASLISSRGARQRLTSKSSMEVYTTIRELVHESSDDEFDASDDSILQNKYSDDDEGNIDRAGIFSMIDTDEYDSTLGRDLITHHSPAKHMHIDALSTFNVLPHLNFDQEVETAESQGNQGNQGEHGEHGVKSSESETARRLLHQQTISDFRNVKPGPTQTVPKTSATLSALDTATIEMSANSNLFFRTITSILAEKTFANLFPLEYPLSSHERVFPGSSIIVAEDEPSTIIAYTLSCEEYLSKLSTIRERSFTEVFRDDCSSTAGGSISSFNEDSHRYSLDKEKMQWETSNATEDAPMAKQYNPESAIDIIKRTLHSDSAIHMKYMFNDARTEFFCKIFFVEQFDTFRHICGCEESYLSSLSSCSKWESSGGKSGSVFLMTKDDRFLIKQISRYEMDAFLRFAPSYFRYMSEAFFHELPTVLCKIFGLYRIGFKNSVTGKSMKMDLVVMENLFYQRSVKKIFDLKGSMRNRHVQVTGRENEVLLDENMVELMYQSPLFLRSHSKESLKNSLHNDTLFLSKQDVMDYSLLVGVDEEKRELVVGIVDFIRTFTWDKKLESWVKDSGILGGGGMEPTIISPKQYRRRFRVAIERYFLMVPDFWTAMPIRRRQQQQQKQQQKQQLHSREIQDI